MPKILRYGEFISRLRDFGVIELPGRGKGSERYLIRPSITGTTKGPSYTIRCHGSGDTVKIGTMSTCLRRLQIDPKEFWK
jgi:hypothetical protein